MTDQAPGLKTDQAPGPWALGPDRWRWAAVAVAAAVVVGCWRFLALPGFGDDHYVHLAGAQQIAFGEWPSRDFVDAGAPLMFALSAAVFWLSPQAPLLGEALLVSFMFAVAAAITVYAARRLTGSLALAIVAVALEIVIFPRTYSYPKVLTYSAAFLAMWRYVDRPSLARMAQLALVVVVTLLLRYDHGVYVGLGGLVAVVLATPTRDSLRKAAVYAAIVLAILTPYLIYVQFYDGLWNHLRRGMEARSLENSRGRRAPPFVLGPNVVEQNAVPFLYYEFHLLPMVTGLVLTARWRRAPNRRELALVLPLIAVAVPMNVGLIRETVSARLPDAVVPACLQLAWLLSLVRDLRPHGARIVAVTASAMVVLATGASAMVVGSTREQLERAEIFGGLSGVSSRFVERASQLRARLSAEQIPSRAAYALLPFFSYVDRCLEPNDHILVPAFLPEVLVWARHPFAGGQIVFQAGSLATNDDHQLVLSRLNAQRVPVAVLHSSTDAILAQFGGLGRYIHDHFSDIQPVLTDDTHELRLAFDGRLAVGRDGDTGWPCYR